MKSGYNQLVGKWNLETNKDSPFISTQENSIKNTQSLIQLHEVSTLVNRYRLDLTETLLHPWKNVAIALLLHSTNNTQISHSLKENKIGSLCQFLSSHFYELGMKIDPKEMKNPSYVPASPLVDITNHDDFEIIPLIDKSEKNREKESSQPILIDKGCLCCTDVNDSQECEIKQSIITAMETGDLSLFNEYSVKWKKKITSGYHTSILNIQSNFQCA